MVLFGVNIESVTTVVAGFMLGLGLGSLTRWMVIKIVSALSINIIWCG